MRTRLSSVALAVGLLGGATAPAAVLTAPVAAAHSVLLSVEPADGATVQAAPDTVTLTFNEKINPSFVTVAVNGTDRTNRVTGTPTTNGEVVTARVAGLDDDDYTVGYRVTSADGHVITGSSRFTVGAGGAAAGAGDAGPTATDASTAEVRADDSSTTGAGTALWVVAGLAVVLIGAAAVLLRGGRRG